VYSDIRNFYRFRCKILVTGSCIKYVNLYTSIIKDCKLTFISQKLNFHPGVLCSESSSLTLIPDVFSNFSRDVAVLRTPIFSSAFFQIGTITTWRCVIRGTLFSILLPSYERQIAKAKKKKKNNEKKRRRKKGSNPIYLPRSIF